MICRKINPAKTAWLIYISAVIHKKAFFICANREYRRNKPTVLYTFTLFIKGIPCYFHLKTLCDFHHTIHLTPRAAPGAGVIYSKL